MGTQQRSRRILRPANLVINVIVVAFFGGLMILFGWQTWLLVTFLFPADNLLMKVLTLISFDILSLVWATSDLFYNFADPRVKTLVRSARWVTFTLSFLASVLYMVIQSMFRFHITITDIIVNIGYGISLFALTLNILGLLLFIDLEWNARHPHQDDYHQEWDVQSRTPRQPSSAHPDDLDAAAVNGHQPKNVTSLSGK